MMERERERSRFQPSESASERNLKNDTLMHVSESKRCQEQTLALNHYIARQSV
jgi:hypothetical protein